VPSRVEVLGDGPVGGEEALRVSRRLEALQAPLPLAGRLVGVFGAIVQVPVLAMFHTREALSLRRLVAFELVRDEDPRHIRQPLQQLAEKFLCRLLMTTALDENIQDVAILIDSSPQIMPGIVNLLHVDVVIGQEGGGAPSVLLPTRQLALSLLASSGSVGPSLVDRPGQRGGGGVVGNVERWDHTRRETVGRALAT
jgi:hypothetical protein